MMRIRSLFVLPIATLALACLSTMSVAADSAADSPSKTATAPAPPQPVQQFLNTYCVDCHGPAEQSGERRFDALPPGIDSDNTLVDYQDILDQLNLSNMPPEDAPQPADAERRQVIQWLTQQLADFHETRQAAGSATVLRRLNSREYRHTVRDLLQLDMTMFDPTEAFPRDQTHEHLDNVGESLVVSGYLLNRYLEAAGQIVEKALQPRQQPQVRTWTFTDNFRQQPEIDQVHRKTNEFSHLTLYDVIGADKHEGAYAPLLEFSEGVPWDGIYEIRFQAEALNRLHPYDPEFLGLDPDEPLRLGIRAGNQLAGPLHKPQPIEPLLAELNLADEKQWYTVRVRLDQGFTPRFTFQNGLMDARNLWSRLLKKYPEQFPDRNNSGIVEARMYAIKYGKLPQIQIHEVQISGPYFDEWPTASQRAVLGPDCAEILDSGTLTDDQIRSQLTDLLTRAYRRLATAEEIKRILAVIQARRTAGRADLEAYADGLQAVLCSPEFLYLNNSAQQGRLTSYALASRLSYFLWSSLPDEELANLAAADAVQDPAVLTAQVQRMLQDSRSEALIEGFLDSWLTLRDLGSMPPDRDDFRNYYHYDLGPAMQQETRLFARHLLDENLSIRNFLDSDFTFVNKPLARLYGLKPPQESGFQLVSLDDRRRGGLLGQASVLTVTANGIDTSPVVRGVWLLDNILGTPPSPPPPDVEPLDPDVRGATTIRDQLQKHRSIASCNDCHRKIDPPGFALENFDPIGQWRERYDGRQMIDASGELPGDRRFDDVVGFKQILLDQQDLFRRALTTRLLSYATGRQLTAADRPHVDQILTDLTVRGDGFRDLIQLIVHSDIFLSP